jgi:hypothetical protein
MQTDEDVNVSYLFVVAVFTDKEEVEIVAGSNGS